MKYKFNKTIVALSVIFGLLAIQQSAYSQTARVGLETYEEGPVWQIMTFKSSLAKNYVRVLLIGLSAHGCCPGMIRIRGRYK